MENNYKDNQLIDENIMKEMAVAYASAVKKLQETNPQTTEQLLSQILQELREIKQLMIFNRRIRLS